ncbi:MAG: hypothetical protein RLZZ302_361 [Actinomycetota bacterium]|jgi:hypothetical protein
MKTPQMKIQSIDTRAVDLLLIRPRLKRGAIVLSLSDSLIEGNRVFVGCNGSGIQCEALGIRTIIAAFDGKKSAQEIAEALAIDSEIVSQVVGQLLSAGLIDYLVTQIVAPGRFKEQDQSSDAGYIQLQSKITPELSATTWITGINDGGVEVLTYRRMALIEISGENRVATQLYGILLASGVTQTKMASASRRDRARIGNQDMCAGLLTSSDVGSNFQHTLEDKARELALFPSKDKSSADEIPEVFLKVFIGNGHEALIAQSMSEDEIHLIVAAPDGPSIDIGPLVIPGKSACSRCVTLARSDQHSLSREIDIFRSTHTELEIPVTVAHFVAAQIASEILRFIDTKKSALISTRVRTNYLDICNPQHIRFARHPLCGCSWR